MPVLIISAAYELNCNVLRSHLNLYVSISIYAHAPHIISYKLYILLLSLAFIESSANTVFINDIPYLQHYRLQTYSLD